MSVLAVHQPLVIWYNTLCPVCRTGVTWQKRLMLPALQNGDIVFSNINDNPTALAQFDVSLEDIRERLHATTPDGHLLVGVHVVAAVMRLTPKFSWLGQLLALPGVKTFAQVSYNGFARCLYIWNRRSNRW